MTSPPADEAGSPVFDLRLPSGSFLRALNLEFDEVTGSRVSGHFVATPEHHTPWGMVHGGVYATVIETAASIGASAAAMEHSQFAVGVNNQTDFLRPFREGRLDVVATPIQQGRNLQLWVVELRSEAGKLIARGQVRLSNQDLG